MRTTTFPWRLLACLVAFATALGAAPANQVTGTGAEAELRARFGELLEEGARARAELADWAFGVALYREAGLLAREVLRVNPEHEIGALVRKLEGIEASAYVTAYREALRTQGRNYRKRLATVVGALADRLAELGSQADKAGQTELAEEIYREALRADSENSKARQALKRLDYEMIFNYGALPKSDKDEARRALRSLSGGFQGARDLAQELEFWTDAWGLNTRHYRFVTNAPHATVFHFARACEDLYQAWDQLFGESRLALRRSKGRHVVYFFDSPVTYQAILRTRGVDAPPVDDVLGFYWGETGIGYFYDSPAFYAGDLTLLFETFYHEGTHQLIDQRLRTAWKGDDTTKYPTAWVGEGIALYMELLEIDVNGDERSYRFGDFIDDDLGSGIDLYLAGELMPLTEFLHCGAETWDAYAASYPHAALVAYFLMHAGGGAYRRAFFTLIEEYESRGGRKEPVHALLKQSEEALAAEFDAFVRGLDARLPRRVYGGEAGAQEPGAEGPAAEGRGR